MKHLTPAAKLVKLALNKNDFKRLLFYSIIATSVIIALFSTTNKAIAECSHGAIICGQTHACGNNTDAVCPIYFGADCSFATLNDPCLDTDCYGLLYGYVFDSEGNPLEDATVHVITHNGVVIQDAATNASGYYELPVFMDRFFYSYITAYAEAQGYDPEYKTLYFFVIGFNQSQNFSLINGSCTVQCTNWQGLCTPSCEGYTQGNDSCQFCDERAMLVCAGKPLGSYAVYNISENNMKIVQCCEGCAQDVTTLPLNIQAPFKHIARAEATALYNDLPVKITFIIGSD